MTEHSDSMLFPWETDAQSIGEPPTPSAAPANTAAAAGADPPVGDSAAPGGSDLKAIVPPADEPPAEIAATPEEHGTARRAERPLVRKEYYSISEVADLVGLPAHVLRYWESQFSVLNPSKNRSGNRVYQRKEIRLILLVKQLLYDEKYTVEGAKQKLEQLRRGGSLSEATGRALDVQLVRVLRDDLRALLQILTPDTV